MTQPQIAELSGVSRQSVNSHLNNIYEGNGTRPSGNLQGNLAGLVGASCVIAQDLTRRLSPKVGPLKVAYGLSRYTVARSTPNVRATSATASPGNVLDAPPDAPLDPVLRPAATCFGGAGPNRPPVVSGVSQDRRRLRPFSSARLRKSRCGTRGSSMAENVSAVISAIGTAKNKTYIIRRRVWGVLQPSHNIGVGSCEEDTKCEIHRSLV
jgi:hypothetical protein